ncbi:MAG: hypothetical protein AB7F79_11895 [Steroidobacteraceae bacterium]
MSEVVDCRRQTAAVGQNLSGCNALEVFDDLYRSSWLVAGANKWSLRVGASVADSFFK